jgi:hypothetical protein
VGVERIAASLDEASVPSAFHSEKFQLREIGWQRDGAVLQVNSCIADSRAGCHSRALGGGRSRKSLMLRRGGCPKLTGLGIADGDHLLHLKFQLLDYGRRSGFRKYVD